MFENCLSLLNIGNCFVCLQILLKLARGIFEEQQSLERVVHKILIESKALFKCEHICVVIVELPLEDEV